MANTTSFHQGAYEAFTSTCKALRATLDWTIPNGVSDSSYDELDSLFTTCNALLSAAYDDDPEALPLGQECWAAPEPVRHFICANHEPGWSNEETEMWGQRISD